MRLLLSMALLGGWSLSCAADDSAGAVNCSFQSAPERFLGIQTREQRAVHDRVLRFSESKRRAMADVRAIDAGEIPRRNFIDDEIFGKLAAMGVRSAPLSSDEEFFRRLHLDLIGRIPTPGDIKAFVADTNPKKRDELIQKLLYSDEFVDKWTMWLGDLLENNANGITVARQINGRNAFYRYIWAAVLGWKSLKDIAYETVTANGNNFDDFSASGFVLNSRVTTGPAQDTYDMLLYKTASTFLGLSHYDCLACHSGRGHLDQLSLWGKNVSRTQAQQMAAFFARTQLASYAFPPGTPVEEQRASFYAGSQSVQNLSGGFYVLDTRYGNRPNRTPLGTLRNLTPAYQSTGAEPKSPYWRTEFAENMVRDPMFNRNLANRLWKAMFNMGLAEPVNALDPARLDPANPPEEPWTFQATHPELLDRLATELGARDFSLREFLRLLVESSAYQLSSTYADEWKLEYVPLFARHYPRRLDGEEVHDALVKATGVYNRYTVQGWGGTVEWAMKLPDTSEPRTNLGNGRVFMDLFLRGNRDTVGRSQAGTIIQQLGLMNDTFINARMHVNQSPVLQAISRLSTVRAIVEEEFLTFLGRMPNDEERERAMVHFTGRTTTAQKNQGIEDLAWTLVNKIEFIFSH